MDTPYEIATTRLRLYAPSRQEFTDLAHGEKAALEASIHATIPPEWPGPRLNEALPVIVEAMAREPGDARWAWVVVEPVSARLIGDIGYHGPLRDGATVEIGYTLLPFARGHGYATEAASALIQWTFTHTRVASIIAQIAPDNTASLRVAAKLGMKPEAAISPDHLCFGIHRPSSV